MKKNSWIHRDLVDQSKAVLKCHSHLETQQQALPRVNLRNRRNEWLQTPVFYALQWRKQKPQQRTATWHGHDCFALAWLATLSWGAESGARGHWLQVWRGSRAVCVAGPMARLSQWLRPLAGGGALSQGAIFGLLWLPWWWWELLSMESQSQSGIYEKWKKMLWNSNVFKCKYHMTCVDAVEYIHIYIYPLGKLMYFVAVKYYKTVCVYLMWNVMTSIFSEFPSAMFRILQVSSPVALNNQSINPFFTPALCQIYVHNYTTVVWLTTQTAMLWRWTSQSESWILGAVRSYSILGILLFHGCKINVDSRVKYTSLPRLELK